jgi:hypothetical protein
MNIPWVNDTESVLYVVGFLSFSQQPVRRGRRGLHRQRSCFRFPFPAAPLAFWVGRCGCGNGGSGNGGGFAFLAGASHPYVLFPRRRRFHRFLHLGRRASEPCSRALVGARVAEALSNTPRLRARKTSHRVCQNRPTQTPPAKTQSR